MIRAFRLWDERREGYEEGYKEGFEEGRIEERISLVWNLLSQINDVAQTAQLLKVPVEEVRRVAETHHLSQP